MGICRALVADEGLLALPDSLHLDAARPLPWLAAEQSSAGTRRYRFNASFSHEKSALDHIAPHRGS